MENHEPDTEKDDSAAVGNKFFQRLWSDLKRQASRAMFWIEVLALIGLALYVGETRRTNNLTHSAVKNSQDTLAEIQQQTRLMRQQLLGTQAAIVSINGPISVEPHPLKTNINISIGFRNDGHVIANKIGLQLKIQVIDLADKRPLGQQWSCDHTIPTLAPMEHSYFQCFIEGLTGEDLKLIGDLKRTVALDGNYTYENGFGEVRDELMCFRFQPEVKTGYGPGTEGSNNFEECGLFNVGREMILRHLEERRP